MRRPSYLTCSYAIFIDDKLWFIDAGMDVNGREVKFVLEKLGKRIDDIGGVLLTHWHNDHSAGATYLGLRDVATSLHARELPFFANAGCGGVLTYLRRRLPDWGPFVLLKGLVGEGAPYPLVFTNSVKDGDRIAGEFLVVETPGHTPGHLAFYWEREKMLFAGDALAVIGNQIRRMARPVTPDLVAARESALKLLELPFTTICPGHRMPLRDSERVEVEKLKTEILSGGRWPLLG